MGGAQRWRRGEGLACTSSLRQWRDTVFSSGADGGVFATVAGGVASAGQFRMNVKMQLL